MDVQYLIIGAGVSGLACASKLPKDSNYLLLEKETEAGGYCRTFYQDGYVWDYAGHFFHFRNEDIRKEFLDLLVEPDMVRNKKNTKIYYKNRYIDYPFQSNIHQLEKDEFIECLVDLFTRKNATVYNFKQMLYSKFGKSITEKFLSPYNTKLYACDLDNLDKDAMGRFFPYAEPEEIVKGFRKEQKVTYNEEFYYSKRGARVFVDRLITKISLKKILFEENVIKIDLENKIVVTNKQEYRYEYLVSTIPFVDFIKFSNIKFDTQLSSNKVLVFNMGFDKKPIDTSIHWIYYPEPEICFYRVGFYNNILHENDMSIYVEIGFPKNEEVKLDYWLDRVLFDLKKVGVVTNHRLLSYNSIIMEPAYVHVRGETTAEKEELKLRLRKQGVHLIGRYGDWTYCSIEDCIAQGYETAALMREGELDVVKNTPTI